MKTKYFFIAAIAVAAIFTSCAKEDAPVVTPFDTAVASKGGILYDKFWATEAGYDQSSANLTALNAKADFFRCKQCHGWDLKGTTGSYINRAPKTSRPNISSVDLFASAKSKTAQELFDAMKRTAGRRNISTDLSAYNPATPSTITEGDKMPNYNELLTDAQIWDIVKFLKEGALDVSLLYDATITGVYPTGKLAFSNIGKGGNAQSGNTYYTAKCKVCHGADGKLIPNLDATAGMTVGKFIRSKPNELQHKIKFGQLGTAMVGDFLISTEQMRDLYKAGTDVTNFPD